MSLKHKKRHISFFDVPRMVHENANTILTLHRRNCLSGNIPPLVNGVFQRFTGTEAWYFTRWDGDFFTGLWVTAGTL
jgi:hypothetical protein